MPFLRAALSFPVLLLQLLLPPGTEASGGTWCYATQDAACGPAHWKVLDHQCGGANQSPINVDRKTARRSSELDAFVFKGYNTAPAGAWSIANSGHAVQVNLGSDISVSGAGLPAVYNALQFHFHWGNPNGNGSEHQLDGNQYPMEVHIVHMHSKYTDIKDAATDPNGLAVLGFFYKVSDTDNTNYNTIIDGLQSVSYSGDSVDLASTFRLDSLLPSENLLSRYYRYRGSLTTPGCAEAVIWTVFEDPIPISSSQTPPPFSTSVEASPQPVQTPLDSLFCISGTVKIINARETVPRNVKPDLLGDCPKTAQLMPGSQWMGVPGEIRGYAEAHRLYGKLPWRILFQPAIELARQGFPIPVTLGLYLRYISSSITNSSLCAVFCDDKGEVLKEGQIVRYPKLADTLELIADHGPDAFYKGPLVEAMVQDTKSQDSCIVTGCLRSLLRLTCCFSLHGNRHSAVFCDDKGEVLKEGQIVRYPKLADTLELIADHGPDAFYKGPLVEAMVQDTKSQGGTLTAEDFENFKAKIQDPLQVETGGYLIYMPPPPAGGAVLSFILKVMEGTVKIINARETVPRNVKPDLLGDCPKTAQLMPGSQWMGVPGEIRGYAEAHRLYGKLPWRILFQPTIELARQGFPIPVTLGLYLRYISSSITNSSLWLMVYDLMPPAFLNLQICEVQNLISEGFANRIRKLINDDRTHPLQYYSRSPGRDSVGTTHVSVLAEDGSAVSVTSTINQMCVCPVGVHCYSLALGSYFNVFVLMHGVLFSGEQPPSSVAPLVFVNKSRNSMLVIGGSGGSMITSSTAQVIMNHLWLGYDLKDAIGAPVLYVTPTNEVQFEKSFNTTVKEELRAMGHTVTEGTHFFNVVNAVSKQGGCIAAVSDARKKGVAAGY
ncbi:UNVERIFIED_CONTAM: hypothetical protein FKN15_062979 [Acipenser sinensis]